MTPLLPTLMGWIPEQKRTKEEPGMMEFCGQLIMFDNGAFQEKKAVFMLITLCGLCPVLLALIVCLAGPDIGLISAVVLIFVFCMATFNMFPPKVSLYRYIVSLGVLLYVHACTSLTFIMNCFVWIQFFWIFVSIIINKLSSVQITSLLGYYYTASEQCVPNGMW